jgi:hypothetical protein
MPSYSGRPVTRFPSERACLVGVLCTGLVLRLVALLRAPAIEMDGIGYATMAEQFARGDFGRACIMSSPRSTRS